MITRRIPFFVLNKIANSHSLFRDRNTMPRYNKFKGGGAMKRNFLFKTVAILSMLAICVIPVAAKETELEAEQIDFKSSLLCDYLGSKELGLAIGTNGLDVGFKFELQDGLPDIFYLSRIFEDSSGELGINWNPIEKYWNLHIGTDISEEISIDADLYGDTECLLFSCNPFYDGTLGIQAGSLAEQYENSGLKALLTELLEVSNDFSISDRNLIFYPNQEQFPYSNVLFGGLKTNLQNKWNKILQNISVESDSSKGEEHYQLLVDTRDILNLGFPIINELIGFGIDISAIDCNDALNTIQRVSWYMERAQMTLGETILFEITKKNGKLSEFAFDMTAQKKNYSYDSDGERTLNYDMIDISGQLKFGDSDDPLKNASLLLKVENKRSESEAMQIYFSSQREISELVSNTSVTMIVKDGSKIVYMGVPFTAAFDANTGEFDAALTLIGDGMDVTNISLESSFTDVKREEGFVWRLEELSAMVEEEKFSLLEGSMWLTTKYEKNCKTESPLMIGEASKGTLFTVISEAIMNYESWMQDYNQLYYSTRMHQNEY